MRWLALVTGVLLLVAAAAGCTRQIFMTESDFAHYHQLGLPDFEPGPVPPPPAAAQAPPPTTVLDLDRQPRYLSLPEAIAVALEQGTVGSQFLTSPGVAVERPVFLPGPGPTLSDSIRVLALAPALTGSNIEAELSRFDARWVTSMTWTTIDQPVATAAQVAQSGGQTAVNTQDATFQTSLLKPLPTGGVAGITFRTDYELTNLPAAFNPSYRPVLLFQFEQPLLQGFGVEINQILPTHPGSILTPFQPGGLGQGILITRLRFDQQRAEFERNVHLLLLNVEVAYWNLYAAYWVAYSREQGLQQAYQTWRINKTLVASGRVSGADLDQARGQYEFFRERHLAAVGQVLEAERQLRALMGLPAADGCRLLPVDEPVVAPFRPDWCTGLNEALTLRPELFLGQEELKIRHLEVLRQKNLLLPDLRFTATYDINGVGTRLDSPEGALHSLIADHFNDWSVGLRLDVPVGFRQAHAGVRAAQLNLASSYLAYRDQQDKIQRQLALEYRQVFEFQERMRALRAEREAYGRQLQKRFQEFQGGREVRLEVLLEAQRFWAQALADEFTAIAQYNNALAGFEFAKGTLLQHHNVVISEGPLPPCAQVRAVEHEEERRKALVLRERANPIPRQGCRANQDVLPLPVLPINRAPSVLSLEQGAPHPLNLPENLPGPRQGTPLPGDPGGGEVTCIPLP